MKPANDDLSRSAIRKGIAASLAASLTSVQQVVDHQASNTGAVSPLVRVMSGGSMRPPSVAAGDVTRFYVILQTWVLFSEIPNRWTEAQAEDALDAVEQEIARWVDQNQQQPGMWKTISYAQRSGVRVLEENGEAWLVEDIVLEVRAVDP